MTSWLTTISPSFVLGIIFGVVLNRLYKIIDAKQPKEVCKQMHKGLEKQLSSIETQNADIVKKIEDQHTQQATMANDIKWIVSELKNGKK